MPVKRLELAIDSRLLAQAHMADVDVRHAAEEGIAHAVKIAEERRAQIQRVSDRRAWAAMGELAVARRA